MILLLLLCCFTPVIIGDVPECTNGVRTFDPPQNRSVLLWYPTNFTNTTPIFPANYECEYQITVPQGWFVRITLSVYCKKDIESVLITDQLQRTERVTNVDEQRFYFIAPGGKIKLTTGNENVQFGFSLYWQQYTDAQSIQLNVSLSDTQPTVLERNGMKPALVKADTKVSATILSPVYNYLIQNLRTLIFFDDSWNSTSLGTGLQLLQGNTQFVSSGSSMTVLPLESFYYDYGQIVLQDYEHTKDIASFQGLKCTLYSRCEDLKLDASQGRGPAAFQLYTQDIISVATVLTGFSGTGNLDVYIGGVTINKTNLISSYSAEPNNLPQEFLGAFKTLMLTNGTANLTMSAFSKTFKETVTLPRKGFIASTEYGSRSTSQDSHSVVTSGMMIAKFSVSIRDVDLSGYATLDINGYKNKTLVFARSYYHSHVPIEQEGFYGDTLDVKYTNYESPNNGFYLDFRMENCAFNSLFLHVLCLVLIFEFFL